MEYRIRCENKNFDIMGFLNEAAQLDLESNVLIIWTFCLPYCILFWPFLQISRTKPLRHLKKSNTFLKRNACFCFKPTPTTLPLILKLALTRARQGYNIGNWGGGPSVRSSDETNHTWKEKACFRAVCFVPDCSDINICRDYLLRLLCEEDKTKDI